MTKLSYGLIGLGELGHHLGASLLQHGFALSVYDQRTEAVQALVDKGASAAKNATDVVKDNDALITCLPSPDLSRQIMLEDGAGAAMKPGSCWIEMGTCDGPAIQSIADQLATNQVPTLAAPVTGGVHRAAAGDITVLAGGPVDQFTRHRPALEAMGGKVFHIGTIEQAASMKITTNMLAFIHLIAAGEAMMLCKKAGIDLTQAFEAIRASSGNSFVHETETQVILNGSYDIAFTIDLALKDSRFALELGRKNGVPLRLASVMEQCFIDAKARYGGNAWSPEVVRLLEEASGEQLRAPGFPARLSPENT